MVESQQKFERKVAYYHGCYVNYNNPQLGKEFIQVFNAMDIGVVLLEKKMLWFAIKRKPIPRTSEENRTI